MCPRLFFFSALALMGNMFFVVSFAWAKVLVTPSISGEETYISNPENTAEDGASGADFRTSISPSLTIEGGKRTLEFNGAIGANAKFHKKDPSLNFIAYNGAAAAKRQFSGGSSVSVNGGVSYTKTSDSLADSVNLTEEPAQGGITGLRPERTGRFSGSYSIGFDGALSELSSIVFNLSESFLLNESSQLLDTRTDSAVLSYNNRLTKELDTSVGYSFSNSSFDAYDYSFDFSEEGGNIATHTADVGISWILSNIDTVALSGGYFITDGTGSVKGWTASADLSRTLKSVDYHFGYVRSTTSTFGLSREINVNETVSAGTGVVFSRMATFSFDASVSKNRTEPSGNIETRTYAGALAVNYTPSLFSTWTVSISAERLESSLDGGESTLRNSYEAGISLNYQLSRSVFLKGGYSHFQQSTKDFPDLAFSREVAYIAVDLKPSGEWYE